VEERWEGQAERKGGNRMLSGTNVHGASYVGSGTHQTHTHTHTYTERWINIYVYISIEAEIDSM
jgi:hypothetical protein